jgi:hypothetical protein
VKGGGGGGRGGGGGEAAEEEGEFEEEEEEDVSDEDAAAKSALALLRSCSFLVDFADSSIAFFPRRPVVGCEGKVGAAESDVAEALKRSVYCIAALLCALSPFRVSIAAERHSR